MYCCTVCDYEVRVNKMISVEEMRKFGTDIVQNIIETVGNVMSVTKQINMF